MISLLVKDAAGAFAENKDVARTLRQELLLPALQRKEEVTIDFTDVEGATQSFVHALISEPFRTHEDFLDKVSFKGCAPAVKAIIQIVVDYLQESL